MKRLSPKWKFIGGGLLALLLVCCGGSAIIATINGPKQSNASAQSTPSSDGARAGVVPAAAVPTVVSPTIAAPSAVVASEPATTPAAARVETKTVTETAVVPFTEKTVNDASLAKGTRSIRTPGVNGAKTLTYQVTYTDGVETSRQLVKEVVTKAPVTQVTAVGTKTAPPPAPPAAKCDPNYTGCVPIASDVDCEGGSGNGPAYVRGPVQVIGKDIYNLDSDNDGWGCED